MSTAALHVHPDRISDVDVDPDLFAKFPSERVPSLFMVLDKAACQTPAASVTRTHEHEVPVLANNHGQRTGSEHTAKQPRTKANKPHQEAMPWSVVDW